MVIAWQVYILAVLLIAVCEVTWQRFQHGAWQWPFSAFKWATVYAGFELFFWGLAGAFFPATLLPGLGLLCWMIFVFTRDKSRLKGVFDKEAAQ